MWPWRSRGRDSELDQELQFHLDSLADELIAKGLPPEQARAEARRQFGNVTQTKERYRDQFRIAILDDFVFDVRQAFRHLLSHRSVTAIIILTIALGIGLNNTVFTIVETVMLRDMPFEEPQRVMALGTHETGTRLIPGPEGYRGVSYPDFRDWRDSTRAFSALAALGSRATVNVSEEGIAPARFQGAYVSANAFDLIGRYPMLGRNFRAEDDQRGAAPTLMLGHAAWTSRYGGDPSILGRTVRVNGLETTIIGVMPAGFQFPATAEVWQPLAMMPGLFDQTRQSSALGMVGRLADGVSISQARGDVRAISSRLAKLYPDTNANREPTIVPYPEAHLPPQVASVFLTMMGAVGFVLLIACANVANLLLARAANRSREIAIRISLGATRWRIVRQLLIESVLLAAIAGVAGLALSLVGLHLFNATLNAIPDKPYWLDFTVNRRVFAFLAIACLGTGLLFGFAPALHISKTNPNRALKEGGRGGSGVHRLRRWGAALVIGEVALTLVLLAGAGFMMRTFLDMYRADPGIDLSHLTTMRLDLPNGKYSTRERRVAFYQQLEDRLGGGRSTSSAALASFRPLAGGQDRQLTVDGRPSVPGARPPRVLIVSVGARYFETLGLPLLRGRTFTNTDGTEGQETAIVNHQVAASYFPNDDPIGRRIRLTPPNAGAQTGAAASASPLVTIVGVSQTVGGQDPPNQMVYLPYRLEPRPSITVIVRDPSDVGTVVSRLREEVRAVDPDIPLFDIQTMDQWMAFLRWPQRVFGTMFSLFACIALIMSAVGLHAVTAHSVAQRTQEIGIRIALGAEMGQVWWLVLRRSLVQLGIGLILGLMGAFGVGQLLQGLFVGTSPRDPITLSSITVMLVLVSLAACFWPARRASRLDPVIALRYE